MGFRMLRPWAAYAIGLLAGAACFGGLTHAAGKVSSIQVKFANIQMLVRGQKVASKAEPFLFDHNVYVPASAIAHALGAQADWNGASRTLALRYEEPPAVHVGNVYYDGLEVYPATNTAFWNAKPYVAGFALALALNQPFYFDSATNIAYIGTGPASGMPIDSFYDVRDYGDYAKARDGIVGPSYGWTDGAPRIGGILYPNGNSLVWASGAPGAAVPGVEYNLRGAYTQVTGNFGLDDASGQGIGAQLTITGDGKLLYQSPWMMRGAQAAPVSVNVKGVQLLTVSFAIQTGGRLFRMGQAVPSGVTADVDFADVNVH